MSAPPSTILVTGNMGYVGPSVVARLRDVYPSATLIGLDTGYFAHNLATPGPLPEALVDVQHFADVRSIDDAVVRDVDAIVHLAAISNDPIGNLYAELTLAVNAEATIRLARMARDAGVRAFAFASSCSVYGLSELDLTTEHAPARPQTPYARSKWLAEQALAELATETFAVTSLRFATACGMSRRLRLDLVLNQFVAFAVATGRIEILSDGTPWRPLIHVDDMARAFEWAISRDPLDPAPFLVVNAGSDAWNYQIRELAEAVQALIPGVAIDIDPAGGPDSRSYRVDFARFRDLAPEHQPEVDLETAIDDLRRGLEALSFDLPALQSARLVRIAALDRLRRDGTLDDELEWTHRHGRRAAV